MHDPLEPAAIPHTADAPAPEPPPNGYDAETDALRAAERAAAAQDLIVNKDGIPQPCVANLITILLRDEWRGRIQYDELQCRPIISGPTIAGHRGPFPRWWRDTDDTNLCEWMQTTLGMVSLKPTAILPAVASVAERQRVHPVREYLRGLRWDGTLRLDTWLTTLLGVVDSPLHRSMGARFLISAVARVQVPGCKADHMLILEGPQGRGKSTALAALMPTPDWFLDDLGDLGKDSAERIQGRWIVEVAEMDSMSKAETTRVKSYVSRQHDTYRPAYGHWAQRFPRQCVFTGSTNEDHYLRDASGARRFWPVRCHTIDVDGVARQRDQLWAEALARYEDGAQWWLDAGEVAEAEKEQADRYEADVWHDEIAEWLLGQEEVSVAGVLDYLKIDRGHRTQFHLNRVARTLQFLGWRRFRSSGTGRPWVYRKPAQTV